MGVRKEYHRKGVGKAPYAEFEAAARREGFSIMQVKTVQSGHSEVYDVTNRFYRSLDFQELEYFSDTWIPWNPCQIFVKHIGLKM